MYVWLHKSQLNEIKGGKGEWTYASPYIIHKKLENDAFILQELSGAVCCGAVNIHLLRLFFYRPDHQTLCAKLAIASSKDITILDPNLTIKGAAIFRIMNGRNEELSLLYTPLLLPSLSPPCLSRPIFLTLFHFLSTVN